MVSFHLHPSACCLSPDKIIYPARRVIYRWQPDVYEAQKVICRRRPFIYPAPQDIYWARWDVYRRRTDVYDPHRDVYHPHQVIYDPKTDVYRAKPVIYTPQLFIYRSDDQVDLTRGFSLFKKPVTKSDSWRFGTEQKGTKGTKGWVAHLPAAN